MTGISCGMMMMAARTVSVMVRLDDVMYRHHRTGCCVYLYTSRTPCGDASIYHITDDIQRTGAKVLIENADSLLPGADYHTTGLTRRKPGRGDVASSMSCTDKITKWCILGPVSSLILTLVDRIDLSGIVIGTNYDVNAVNRAFKTRISEHFMMPVVINSTVKFEYDLVDDVDTRPCGAAIGAWKCDNVMIFDVINGTRGIRHGVTMRDLCRNDDVIKKQHVVSMPDHAVVRLCKRKMFIDWHSVYVSTPSEWRGTYDDAKHLHVRDKKLVDKFEEFKTKCGGWLCTKDKQIMDGFCL